MATDYDDVKCFLAVAEAGGLSRAAQRLATSKSAVSRRMTRLEEEVGARLLTRNADVAPDPPSRSSTERWRTPGAARRN